MKSTTRMALALCTALASSAALAAPVQAAPEKSSPSAQLQQECTTAYENNWLLGADPLPTKSPLKEIVSGWHRIDGSASSEAFLKEWRTVDGKDWLYPKNDGFDGKPQPETLAKGTQLDRFGQSSGRFLSPFKTNYAKRAIPPSNLRTYPNDVECNYHRYEVVKPFAVQTGKIAKWFGQDGGGTQKVLAKDDSVQNHINSGDLKEVSPAQTPQLSSPSLTP
ncbi:TNT domain-containing protein [Streptomyces celluloflavus]|uniref:TNT domain-containing protein n=1 Tax=Streptomyces celluloflavus TaxID=58344 RepID=A0ABW7RNY4_9ACTN